MNGVFPYFCTVKTKQQRMDNQWIRAKWHIIAVLTVGIWGTTFISTKVLMGNGLTPQEIFLLRFIMAYAGIWLISPQKLFADSLKDEGWLFLSGITGGSLYFLTENTALGITQTTNVAFIVCSTPLITTLLTLLFYPKEKASRWLMTGSLVALLGVAFLVFNGNFVLKLSPLGDCLSLAASLLWAFYSLIIRKVEGRYSTVFITRKVFFYGLLTILPYFLLYPWQFPLQGLMQTAVWGNLLFLGLLASLICFVVWNLVLKHLGTIDASNYLYLNPLFTTVASLLFLDERFTWMSLIGAAFVLTGVYLSGKK